MRNIINNETEILIDSLLSYYNVSSIGELAKKLDVSQPTVSKWKSRNSINAIKKKCRKLGIYREIFDESMIIKDNDDLLNERIKTIRKKLGYKSREEFATKINIPFATFRSYEQGKIDSIPHSFLMKLLNSFNINLNWLMSGKGDMIVEDNVNKKSDHQKINIVEPNNDILKIIQALNNIAEVYDKEDELKEKLSDIMVDLIKGDR